MVRIEFITGDKQGQIEISSVAFLSSFALVRAINGAPDVGEAPGSLFTNAGSRGIVRAVCRLVDSGTTVR